MRLILDEHLAPHVAASLRDRGHDVVAVSEREELRGRTDTEILMAAATERRVVVTSDVRDFGSRGARRLPSREWHCGIVLVPRRAFARDRDAFGRLIRALEALLAAYPGEDDAIGQVIWLHPTAEDAA